MITMSNELIQQYQNDPTTELGQKLLQIHSPFIQSQTNKWKGILPDAIIEAKAKQFALNAFKTYDPNKASINTHLYNHLSPLSRMIYENQNVAKLPEHQIQLIGSINTAKEYLKDVLNREPNAVDIADHLSLPVKHIQRVLTNNRKDLLFDSDAEDIQFQSTNSTNILTRRLESLRNHLPQDEKEKLDHLIGYNVPALSPQAFGKKYKMKPYEVSRLKEHFAKKIKE